MSNSIEISRQTAHDLTEAVEVLQDKGTNSEPYDHISIQCYGFEIVIHNVTPTGVVVGYLNDTAD